MSEALSYTYAWNRLPWRKLEVVVFKLKKRIYRASQAGDVRRVRRLQRLLMKSRAAKYLAVRRVTQDNQGKRTAGIDGVKSLSQSRRLRLVKLLGALPLGIPTMHDRALQALTKDAMEPEWEAKFEPNSYGFRPGRSVHDAIEAIFTAIKLSPKYVLDADIEKCFDRINHEALLCKINASPMLKRHIKRWLKAGVLDNGVFEETEVGTPQGGVLTPLTILQNIALWCHRRSHRLDAEYDIDLLFVNLYTLYQGS
jgi:Retron-type reverse transcriptase